MDSLQPPPGNNSSNNNGSSSGAGSSTPNKRLQSSDDGPPSKKVKPNVEVPAVYSDAVRKKLAATSRTGQACDRCKERKMKCDTDPIACQPCRQKHLRCYTTDRVTGQSRERGQTDRAENELTYLREQNIAYERKYGPLQPDDFHSSVYTPGPEPRTEPNSYPRTTAPMLQDGDSMQSRLPSTQYVGWPAPDHIETLHAGPIHGTKVDVLDGIIDIADFECDTTDEYTPTQSPRFNYSRTSITSTIAGYQRITDPRLPSKEDALRDANTFLVILSQFVPIVHRPSFIQMVNRLYDHPQTATLPEQIQLVVVLAIIAHQSGVRNHHQAVERFDQSYHWLHYALTYYRELLRDKSLAAMQALALIILHFRNLTKPGYSWAFSHKTLVKAMDQDYHRDPDKIELPPEENNILAKELRKRIFHSVFGICVTTGCRVSKAAPWQFQHIDVPLPMAIKDAEISEHGLVQPLSGNCDFWPCIQLAKQLPLFTDIYNHVLSVRRSESDYVKTVEILHAKIDAWRRDWDESISREEKHPSIQVATLLIETWAAEYTLNLYHPSVCPDRSSELMERHLDVCHRQAQRLLKSFHILSSRYKGVDFTWHSTVAYALGFGITLHVYRHRKNRATQEQFDAMKNELKGWMSLMAYADLVMRTGNHLQHLFEPRVRRLEDEYTTIVNTLSRERYAQQSTSTQSMVLQAQPPRVKSEPSPQQTQPSAMHKGQVGDQASMQYAHQTQTTTQPWSTPMQYMSPHTPGGSAYGSYGSHSPYPISLAPLLNDPSNGYIGYHSPSHALQSDMMMFSPTHYTDGTAAVMWPMISLPTQQHKQGLDDTARNY